MPSTPVKSASTRPTNPNPNPNPNQPVFKMLKQKANLVTSCGGGGGGGSSHAKVAKEPSSSILNRLFSRSRSKDNKCRFAEIQTFNGNKLATAAAGTNNELTHEICSSNNLNNHQSRSLLYKPSNMF